MSSRETTVGFLKTEKKIRIDYQYIMRGINKLFFDIMYLIIHIY